jgi:hypothetical protein
MLSPSYWTRNLEDIKLTDIKNPLHEETLQRMKVTENKTGERDWK